MSGGYLFPRETHAVFGFTEAGREIGCWGQEETV